MTTNMSTGDITWTNETSSVSKCYNFTNLTSGEWHLCYLFSGMPEKIEMLLNEDTK